MPKKPHGERLRVQFELTPDQIGQLQRCMKKIGAASMTETFRRALNFLDEIICDGRTVLLRDKKGNIVEVKLV